MAAPNKSKSTTRWYKRKLLWIPLGVITVITLVLVFALDPIIDAYMRKQFAEFKDFDITFEHAHLRPLHADLAVTHFKVVKAEAGGDSEPLIYMDNFDFGIQWKEIIHGNLVATLKVEKAKVHLIAAKTKAKSQLNDLPDIGGRLEKISPLRFDRIQVKDAELTFIDRSATAIEPRIWLHDFDVTGENLATRAALARGEPTILAVNGHIQKNGEITAYITADPLAKGLWFEGEASAKGIQVNEFHDLIASHSGIALDQGTLDVLAKFNCKDNHITGGVRPVLKNAHVIQVKHGVDNWFKAGLADVALKIFENHTDPTPDGIPKVATTIPINGSINDPKVELWPTIFGVVRNAFVEGVTESFMSLPAPVAEKQQPLIEQAVDALNKGKGAPKTQPVAPAPKDNKS